MNIIMNSFSPGYCDALQAQACSKHTYTCTHNGDGKWEWGGMNGSIWSYTVLYGPLGLYLQPCSYRGHCRNVQDHTGPYTYSYQCVYRVVGVLGDRIYGPVWSYKVGLFSSLPLALKNIPCKKLSRIYDEKLICKKNYLLTLHIVQFMVPPNFLEQIS